MASKNKLLVPGGAAEEEKEVKPDKTVEIADGWPKRLYHKDFPKGKVFQTKTEQEEMYKVGWAESPADVGKVIEIEDEDEITFDAFKPTKSKVDVSEKKPKKGKK